MNDQDRMQLERQLEQREDELQSSIRGLRDEIAAPDGDAGTVRDSVEDGDARMMASIDLTQVGRLEGELRDVRQARERMRQGDYGVCEECAKEIPVARLRVRPEARLCITHEEARENANPGNGPAQG